MTRSYWRPAGVFAALMALDAVTTILGGQLGIPEMNPLVLPVLGAGLAGLLVLKLLATLAALAINYPFGAKGARNLVILSYVMVIPVALNLWTVVVVLHR